MVSISDIDGLVKSASLDLFFQHAPTVFVAVNTTVAIPGQDLLLNVTVSDLDGLDRVVCFSVLTVRPAWSLFKDTIRPFGRN